MKCYGFEFEVYNHDVNVCRIGCENVWWFCLKKSCHAIWGLVYDRIYDLVLIISFENRRRAGGYLLYSGGVPSVTGCGCKEHVRFSYSFD